MRLLSILAACATLLCGVSPALAQVSRVTVNAEGSGTVTTAGVSQTVFSRNDARAFLMCQNPLNATEPLFVTYDDTNASTTGGSTELAPGGTIFFAALAVPIASVRVTAATAGHRFVCKAGR